MGGGGRVGGGGWAGGDGWEGDGVGGRAGGGWGVLAGGGWGGREGLGWAGAGGKPKATIQTQRAELYLQSVAQTVTMHKGGQDWREEQPMQSY